jgi:phospholipid-transporting ATPase
MNLKALMINGRIYKDCFDGSLSGGIESSSIQEFLELISLCHTVMIDKRTGSFQASSPDELALLEGTKKLGVTFTARTSESARLKSIGGALKSFQIKAIIEFTSERKRMSVILFDPESEKYYIVTKGADSVVLPLCSNPINAAERCVEEFSIEGLRTLCFAKKELDSELFESWFEEWNQASNIIGPQRQSLLDSCIKNIESDLNFIGVSGIEDGLQVGVPETINTLLTANIKIWILTGDRGETAMNTAFLSGILKPHHTLIKLLTPENVKEFFNTQTFSSSSTSNETAAVVILVSGDSFANILNHDELRKAFIPISEGARSIIGCRLSPLQKTEITHFVQNDLGKITLAVGDGGNDVGMIQAADVGVGINGLEGTQAARSSDFSIAKFRFLVKLLLVHGAWSFHRISRVILYMMYKNFVLVLCQFWFAFFNSFSSQSAFSPSLLLLYNSLFSAVPPVLIGISDQYVTAPELIKHPQLYQFGQKGKFVRKRKH